MSTENGTVNNGDKVEIPESRKAAYERDLAMWHEREARLEAISKDNDRMKIEIAGYKVTIDGMQVTHAHELDTIKVAHNREIDALQSRLTDAESRMGDAIVQMDASKRDAEKYKTVLVSIQAQLRAFEIPNGPLVTRVVTDNMKFRDSEGTGNPPPHT